MIEIYHIFESKYDRDIAWDFVYDIIGLISKLVSSFRSITCRHTKVKTATGTVNGVIFRELNYSGRKTDVSIVYGHDRMNDILYIKDVNLQGL